jgi:hypothetical protein
MTDTTATQNLTRTTATDDPRQMASYIQRLATDIDQRMTAHYHDLDRSSTPPAACIRVTTPVTVDSAAAFPQIVFDTVMFDTAGLVDLTNDPRQIQLLYPGYWCIGAYVQTSGFGGGSTDVGILLKSGGSTTNSDYHDASLGVSGSYSLVETTLSGQGEIAALGLVALGSPSTFVTTVTFAELWAYKIRDT